ncbi:MAG: hypothetical protein ACOYBY_07850 [Dermatophilaceae bacterium]
MRRARVAMLGLAGVWLAGCTVGATPASPTLTVTVEAATSASGTGAGDPTAATSAGPIVDAGSHDSVAFASPTGRINCAAYQQPAAWSLRCDVLDNTWTPPPKPPDCQGEWGTGVYLTSTGAGLVCASDTVAYEAKVGADATWWNGQPGSQVVPDPRRGDLVALSYGATMTMGPISCVSRQDGMHCTDNATKAGFDVAREHYTLR